MTSPADGEQHAPSPDGGEQAAVGEPSRDVPPEGGIVWGPPRRPDDLPFAAPQPSGGRGSASARWSLGTDRSAGAPIERGGVTALMLGIAGLFLVIFPPVGVVFGILAIRAGLRARRRAAAANGVAPGAGAGIITGISAIIASSLVMIVAAVFVRELRDYQECMSAANTNVAERDCREHLNDDIRRRLGLT